MFRIIQVLYQAMFQSIAFKSILFSGSESKKRGVEQLERTWLFKV